MSDAITKELSKVVLSKVKNIIDVDKFAETVAPKIKKELYAAISDNVRDLAEEIMDNIDLTEIEKIIQDMIIQAVANRLGVKRKKKAKRK
jgi:hypothetical protein